MYGGRRKWKRSEYSLWAKRAAWLRGSRKVAGAGHERSEALLDMRVEIDLAREKKPGRWWWQPAWSHLPCALDRVQ